MEVHGEHRMSGTQSLPERSRRERKDGDPGAGLVPIPVSEAGPTTLVPDLDS